MLIYGLYSRRGSGSLSHLYVHHRDLFTSLVFMAVGFIVAKEKIDIGQFAYLPLQRPSYRLLGLI